MTQTLAIVLAAGKGTRMQSDLPKVLYPVLGRPMIHFVLDALGAAGIERVLAVVGYRADDVRRELADRGGVEFVEQKQQLGTGHAVDQCRGQLTGHDGSVLIVTGDSPLTQPKSLVTLIEAYQRERPACLLGTLEKEDPSGLGRIVRDSEGQFVGIVEQRDATPEQQRIREVNMSTYVFDSRELLAALGQITNKNRQGEYYLTDCPGILRDQGKNVMALPVLQPCEALSINTLDELRRVEDTMRGMGYR